MLFWTWNELGCKECYEQMTKLTLMVQIAEDAWPNLKKFENRDDSVDLLLFRDL